MADSSLTAAEFSHHGAVLLPRIVDDNLVARLQSELPSLVAERGDHVFFEADGHTVRAIYGLHTRVGPWADLVRLPALTSVLDAIFGEPYYVFQYKLNPKAPRVGERWEWHRDYTYWKEEDNMPAPLALTVALLLSDVDDTAGPTVVVRGTHHLKLSDHERRLVDVGTRGGGSDDDWARLVSDGLPYTVTDKEVSALATDRGTVSCVGPAGTAMIFHSNAIHGSLPNLSSSTRQLLLITFNPVSNAPRPASRRPTYFINHQPHAERLTDQRLPAPR